MAKILKVSVGAFALMSVVNAAGLYGSSATEAQESVPLKWNAGVDFTYDDNINPTAGAKDGGLSANPFVGVSFTKVDPQTTVQLYARLGLVHYFDQPEQSSKSTFAQTRIGLDVSHSFNERLRFASRNFVAYELEPDYSYGFANTRQVGEYLYWQTDNSVGYRWSERLGTYTGLTLSGLSYQSVANSDRFTWGLYHQFRYQVTPQTVWTAEYRYTQTTGADYASDSVDQYITAGIEHRLSPTTLFTLRGGVQLHELQASNASSQSTPFVEATFNTQVNSNFTVSAFARYSLENYDTVRALGNSLYEFQNRETFRLGVNANYAVSRQLSLFAGIDYIPSTFNDGVKRAGASPVTRYSGLSEDIYNVYLGASVKLTDNVYLNLSYNHTDSSSDFGPGADYQRNRYTVGVRAEF